MFVRRAALFLFVVACLLEGCAVPADRGAGAGDPPVVSLAPADTARPPLSFPKSWVDANSESTIAPPSLALDLDAGVELNERLLFSPGSANVSAPAQLALRSIAALALAKLTTAQILAVDGYVDDVGSAAANLRLSEKRADAIGAELLANEPALAGRISLRGHGEDELLHPSCRGDCPQNRVVIIKLETSKGS
jgi:outer membrane protein OmpA-like peptidoglycan-associated protein